MDDKVGAGGDGLRGEVPREETHIPSQCEKKIILFIHSVPTCWCLQEELTNQEAA